MCIRDRHTANQPNCNTYGTIGGHFPGKNITCPFFLSANHSNSSCTSDRDTLSTQNGSVLWCIQLTKSFDLWSACINGSSRHYSMQENVPLSAHNITVLDNGQLKFPSIDSYMKDATLNCSVFNEDSQHCAFVSFTFTALSRSKYCNYPISNWTQNISLLFVT